MSVALFGVPSSAGAHHLGQERAPSVLRERGLVRRLEEAGVSLTDRGDLGTVRFGRDDAHPTERSLAAVSRVVHAVRSATLEATRTADRLLVLGGDCTLTIGVVAGLVERFPDLGLFYLDGDIDVTTPATTRSGIFDGMGMAHLLGEGSGRLARIGPRFPLLTTERVVFFGANPESGWFDPPEVEFLAAHSDRVFASREVRSNPQRARDDARELLGTSTGHYLLHFDVDVIDDADFPGADTPHAHGLGMDDVLETLRQFANDERCVGVVVTEFNPERDPDGALAGRLSDGLVRGLAGLR